jgi:acyl-CoA synthetase (AMP-forming)/AMP-acid ligase II
MDADGYVTFTGVMKAMFTRNGFNIYPREIERVVSEMPGVKKVTVRAIPDAMRENDIAIDITGTVTEENVHAWCRANLAVYKQPSRVEIKLA